MSFVTPALAAPVHADEAQPGAAAQAAIVAAVEERMLAWFGRWQDEELDERVLLLVERRLQEETERRSWRRGTEVF